VPKSLLIDLLRVLAAMDRFLTLGNLRNARRTPGATYQHHSGHKHCSRQTPGLPCRRRELQNISSRSRTLRRIRSQIDRTCRGRDATSSFMLSSADPEGGAGANDGQEQSTFSTLAIGLTSSNTRRRSCYLDRSLVAVWRRNCAQLSVAVCKT
jgi:hypothetical protein